MPFASAFQFGHSGVDFFFVLSGFIILTAHMDDLNQPGRLFNFLERRATRIYPSYWVALLATMALAVFSSNSLPPLSWDVFAKSLALLPIGREALLGVSWTLTHEITFYALFAVMIVHFRLAIAMGLLWLAFIAWYQASNAPALPLALLGVMGSVFNIEFLLGMLAAFWLRRHRAVPAGALTVVTLSVIATMVVTEALGRIDSYGNLSKLIYGLTYMLLTLAMAQWKAPVESRSVAFMLKLGRSSYAIYLFHLMGIGLSYKLLHASHMTERLPSEFSLLIIAACGIGLGVWMSERVEQPMQRYFAQRRRNA